MHDYERSLVDHIPIVISNGSSKRQMMVQSPIMILLHFLSVMTLRYCSGIVHAIYWSTMTKVSIAEERWVIASM